MTNGLVDVSVGQIVIQGTLVRIQLVAVYVYFTDSKVILAII